MQGKRSIGTGAGLFVSSAKVPDGLVAILIRYTKYSKDFHLKEKEKTAGESEKFKVQSLEEGK